MRGLLLLAAVVLLGGCVSTAPKYRSPRTDKLDELEDPKLEKDYQSQWRAAQICNDLADEQEEHREKSQRREFAKRGLGHAERAIKLQPELVEGHFFKMLCLGRYLELCFGAPESILVADLRDEGERTARIDDHYENAGAHRFLGIFYSECPESGPYPYGDVAKAEEHFQKALEIAGDWPENLLAYATFQVDKMENAGPSVRKLVTDAQDALSRHPGLSAEQRESLKAKAAKLLDEIDKRAR